MEKSKQEIVYQKIKEYILIGELKNNTRVTERALADKMNVTRIPIRESLVKLEQDGLIRKIPFKGYIIENYSPEELKEAIMLRFTIECEAVSKAALKATSEDILELKKLNEALKNAGNAGNIEVVIENDRNFHLKIVAASHSKILRKLYSMISIPVFYIQTTVDLSKAIKTYRNHLQIINAIENKDPDTAFTLIYNNTPGRDYFNHKFYNSITKNTLTTN